LDTMLQVISTKPMPPSRWQPQIPSDLEQICLACLEKKPTRRYASAEALADDLRRFLAGQRPTVRPGGLASRLFGKGRPGRKVAWAFVGASALVMSLVLLLAFWPRGRPLAGEDAPRDPGVEGIEEGPPAAEGGVKEAEVPPKAPTDDQAFALKQATNNGFSLR